MLNLSQDHLGNQACVVDLENFIGIIMIYCTHKLVRKFKNDIQSSRRRCHHPQSFKPKIRKSLKNIVVDIIKLD